MLTVFNNVRNIETYNELIVSMLEKEKNNIDHNEIVSLNIVFKIAKRNIRLLIINWRNNIILAQYIAKNIY